MSTITFKQLKPLLSVYLQENIVPFLAGEPGIGKSALVKSLAQENDTQVFVLSVNQLGTREDLTGARSIKGAKTNTYRQVFFPHAIIQEAIDYAQEHQDEHPILFLDEINRTSPDVTSAILALITERRVGTTNLPDNIRIIAAGNDQGNVNNLDQASITRMAIFHVTPDINDYLAANPDLNFYIRELLRQHPDYLVQTHAENDDEDSLDNDDDPSDILNDLDSINSMTQMTVPRTLTYASQFLNALDLNGQTVTQNVLDNYYDPMKPTDSALYFGLVAQLGHTKTCHDLFDTITTSIDHLLSAHQTSTPAVNNAIKLPAPNQNLLKKVLNVNSVDDFNDSVITRIGSHKTYSHQTGANTFFSLLRPENLKQLPSYEVLNHYYDYLAKVQDQLPTKFNRYFVVALQNNLVPDSLIKHIKNDSTDLSHGLNQLIDVLNL